MHNHILSIILFTPLVGALLLLFCPKEKKDAIRWIANIFALAGLLVSIPLVPVVLGAALRARLQVHGGRRQQLDPVTSAPATYLGIDGISFLLIMLTTLLGWISILSSWTAIREPRQGILRLVPGAADGHAGRLHGARFLPVLRVLGSHAGADVLHHRHLGRPAKALRRHQVLPLYAGRSVLMLLGILSLYFQHLQQFRLYTFEHSGLMIAPQIFHDPAYGSTLRSVFLGLLPRLRHQGADVPVPHLAAGRARGGADRGLGDPGGRSAEDGDLRLPPLLAAALPGRRSMHPEVRVLDDRLSIIGIIYGALVSLMQKDWKKLVAYSSVSHLGFCTLGIFALNPAGMSGSVLQQINHGISTGTLFLIVGILYERRHTREISEYGGISNVMPVYATITMIMFLSSMGLPLLNGFVGEFTILQGTFMENWMWAAWAVPGVILGAAYLLWLYQRVFFGQVTNAKNEKLTT